jgi:hypothetical protein
MTTHPLVQFRSQHEGELICKRVFHTGRSLEKQPGSSLLYYYNPLFTDSRYLCPLPSHLHGVPSALSCAMKASHNSSPRSPSRSHSSSMSPNQNHGKPTAARSPLPWFTESYFSSEPATSTARKIYIILLASKGLLIIIFLLSVLSIYWGALWQTPAHTHNLNNWVVVSPTSQNFSMRNVKCA